MAKRYNHMGYPKCGSTSLQVDILARQQNILHLGAGMGDNPLGYIDEDIQIAVECDLRYRKDFAYDAVRVKAAFQRYFDMADADERVDAVGVSSEHFSFTFSNDIDMTVKAQRLADIFGDNTSIVMITRNQEDLLESLYAEYIRCGFSATYAEFLNYTYLHQDRNFFTDFMFDKMFDYYASLFGVYNVHLIPFEILKQSSSEYLRLVSQAIGVELQNTELGQRNKRLSSASLELMRLYNSESRYMTGNDFYSPFHLHRMGPYFTKEMNVPVPTKAIMDVQLRNAIMSISEKLGQNSKGIEINMEAPDYLLNQILSAYKESNKRLQAKIDFDLASLGYEL